MTLSHLTLVPTSRLPRTDMGQTILDDRDTNESWWSMRDDQDQGATVVLAGIDTYAPASTIVVEAPFQGVREPDLYDEGRAHWFLADGVVSVEAGNVERVVEVAKAERMAWVQPTDKQGLGFSRVHPSYYGVDVTSYHDGDHSAHTAWGLIDVLLSQDGDA
jgi:hypothetical protein